MTYSYDPTKIRERGKDQMRFELGDTLTDDGSPAGRGAESCVLADEEYEAFVQNMKPGKKAWLFAKLSILEAVLLKLSYMVDTKIDVLTYGFGDRAEQWLKLYDRLRAQYLANINVPTMDDRATRKPPYYFTGIQENIRAKLMNLKTFPFRNMTE